MASKQYILTTEGLENLLFNLVPYYNTQYYTAVFCGCQLFYPSGIKGVF